MGQPKASPFVKWAGGKRQLLQYINNRLPVEYERYIEPFVGGGAVFFELQPDVAFINDINRGLINAYRRIKEKPDDFMIQVSVLDENVKDGQKDYFYKVREKYNDKIVFIGGVDTQQLLPFGTPEQVRDEVRRLKRLFGPNFIVSPSHEAILPNVPPENIAAMAEAALE